ncbi:hypothetical protein [Dyella caseinilytica]|uniref:Uncharacterized protein n=1 Tax=Dyella caseinilytica TaxID=1849581 RepID=A0ABX7GYF3_9GAMM|nr:hypothetical protein [Dyella caseinilytica]QRN54864.1 hypothetical protein ISN74_05785 [Dyella caseinilytica]
MNNLHLHAVRRRAANTFHQRKTSPRASGHSGSALPVGAPFNNTALSLRAQWFRNALSGKLECRWISEAPTESHPRMSVIRAPFLARMHRHVHRAGLRPPSRKCANG